MIQVALPHVIQLAKDSYIYYAMAASLFTIAWWFRSMKVDLFAKLDKALTNELPHIQAAVEKTADEIVELRISSAQTLAAQQEQTRLLTEIRDGLREVK